MEGRLSTVVECADALNAIGMDRRAPVGFHHDRDRLLDRLPLAQVNSAFHGLDSRRRVACDLLRDPSRRLEQGGLIMFFFQYLAQAGLFFVVPLFLSVCLGLSALATGARLLPLSVTLLAAAIGVPRLFPTASPRFVVRSGLLALLAGTVVLLAGPDKDAGAEVVFVPMLLIGLGIGALASQLGAVTVSAVPDEQSAEVGVQNTMTNLGASIGTALAGSILIAATSASFLADIDHNPAIPSAAKSQAHVKLAGGVPFVSDADLEAALAKANANSKQTEAALNTYRDGRIDGLRSALAILAVLVLVALFYTSAFRRLRPECRDRTLR
jgi:Na+/melibiose symporter-like transporter